MHKTIYNITLFLILQGTLHSISCMYQEKQSLTCNELALEMYQQKTIIDNTFTPNQIIQITQSFARTNELIEKTIVPTDISIHIPTPFSAHPLNPKTNEQALFYGTMLAKLATFHYEGTVLAKAPQPKKKPSIKKNKKNGGWECPCKISFYNCTSLLKHIKECHQTEESELFICPLFSNCNYLAKRPSQVIYHLEQFHKAFKTCCTTIFTKENYEEHQLLNKKHYRPKQRNFRRKNK